MSLFKKITLALAATAALAGCGGKEEPKQPEYTEPAKNFYMQVEDMPKFKGLVRNYEAHTNYPMTEMQVLAFAQYMNENKDAILSRKEQEKYIRQGHQWCKNITPIQTTENSISATLPPVTFEGGKESADTFNQLVERHAKHEGISVDAVYRAQKIDRMNTMYSKSNTPVKKTENGLRIPERTIQRYDDWIKFKYEAEK